VGAEVGAEEVDDELVFVELVVVILVELLEVVVVVFFVLLLLLEVVVVFFVLLLEVVGAARATEMRILRISTKDSNVRLANIMMKMNWSEGK
jgi:hypothetical protein